MAPLVFADGAFLQETLQKRHIPPTEARFLFQKGGKDLLFGEIFAIMKKRILKKKEGSVCPCST